MIKVTIWNEFRHERFEPQAAAVYPQGIHMALKEHLQSDDLEIRTAVLDDPSHGLPPEVLNDTDVLLWWGHIAHHEVSDEIAEAVAARVLDGMGLVVLHSGHYSKVFKKLMGTTCTLKWRVAGEKEYLWVVDPAHPIVQGIGEYVELAQEEMYGEAFDVPGDGVPVLMGWFQGGNVFRSGLTFRRGNGKIFYFQPGHETFPTYHNEKIIKLIGNAVRWAEPVLFQAHDVPDYPALEDIRK